MLALKAKIEADKAGDRGRRFTVAAGKVKAQAQQPSNATQEINDLIEKLN